MPEGRKWSMGEREGEKRPSSLNGALFADRLPVFKIVLKKWWVVGIIVLLLLIALGGWAQAIRNGAKVDGLLTEIETMRVEFEREVGLKDLAREAQESAYNHEMEKLRDSYSKNKRKYTKRRSKTKKWNPPKNLIETAKRFRIHGYEAYIR